MRNSFGKGTPCDEIQTHAFHATTNILIHLAQ